MKVMKECKKHGSYEAEVINSGSIQLFSRCPQCVFEIEILMEEKGEEEKKHRLAQAVFRNRKNCGIPLKYENSCIETLEKSSENQSRAIQYASRYIAAFENIKNEGVSMIFFGTPGTGKTHIACSVALALINKGFSAKYTTAFDLLNEISDTFRTKEPTQDVVKEYTRPDLLIIDEVGIQYGKDHDSIWLYKIINTRYVNNSPTIVISNLDQEALEAFIGAPTYDRLQEGKGAAIPFFWESHRRKTALKLAS